MGCSLGKQRRGGEREIDDLKKEIEELKATLKNVSANQSSDAIEYRRVELSSHERFKHSG